MKNIKTIIKNFLFFIILIVITFSIIFKNRDFNQIVNIILSINPIYLLLGIFCMSLYFLFEGLNVRNILKTFNQKISILNAFKYTIIEFFFSGITPAASGGQPMEIYFMNREGVPVVYSTVALLVHLIFFQFITIVCGIIGIIVNYNMCPDGYIYIFIIGVSLNLIALLTMLVCLFCMPLAKKIVNIFIRILELFKYHKLEQIKISLNDTLNSYYRSSALIKKHPEIFIKAFIFAFLQIFAFYSISYFIYRAFGLNDYSFIQILSIQAFVYVSISSIPLPGTVGISESAFITIYSAVFGTEIISGAMLLNRGVNFYLFIIIGLIVTAVTWLKIKNKDK